MEIAAPDTLLGQLQRGRGAGFLWAMREQPEAVHPLLLECVQHDARWDKQIEHRAAYYAKLIIHSGMSLDPLDGYLRTCDDTDRFGHNTPQTVDVLGKLAHQNYLNAVDILRSYVEYGQWWDEAIEALAQVPGKKAHVGLDAVIAERFKTREALEEGLNHWSVDPDAEWVWQEWQATNPHIARILEGEESLLYSAQSRSEAQSRHTNNIALLKKRLENLTTEQLLDMGSPQDFRYVTEVASDKAGPADRDLLLAAFNGPHFTRWIIAFQALQTLGMAELAYEPVLKALRGFFESPVDRKGWVLGQASRVLKDLPPEMTLELARSWFVSPVWHLRNLGGDILEEHATPEDIPLLHAALSEAMDTATPDNTDIYRACTCLDALTRFWDIGPLPHVEEAFNTAQYSHARRRAAEAMYANAPDYFTGHMAFECLWDCEEETRTLACDAVDLSMPGVVEGLSQMAADPFEYPELRQKARDMLKDAGGATQEQC